MNKEEFIKKLKHELRYLNTEAQEEEITKYQNLQDYNLDIYKIANDIYDKRGLKIKVQKKEKFLDSLALIIKNFKSKNSKDITNTIFFFLYVFIFIILIKIPFIYIRDIISSIFNIFTANPILYTIWSLIIELLYALSSILIFIKFIKIKAREYEDKK